MNLLNTKVMPKTIWSHNSMYRYNTSFAVEKRSISFYTTSPCQIKMRFSSLANSTTLDFINSICSICFHYLVTHVGQSSLPLKVIFSWTVAMQPFGKSWNKQSTYQFCKFVVNNIQSAHTDFINMFSFLIFEAAHFHHLLIISTMQPQWFQLT